MKRHDDDWKEEEREDIRGPKDANEVAERVFRDLDDKKRRQPGPDRDNAAAAAELLRAPFQYNV